MKFIFSLQNIHLTSQFDCHRLNLPLPFITKIDENGSPKVSRKWQLSNSILQRKR